jgi:very-short-patch-repair endonuclease
MYCHAAKLLIEVDGISHANKETDEGRDLDLKSIGVQTIRVPAKAIQDNVDAVVEWILRTCQERIAGGSAESPSPLARLRRRGPLPEGEGS